MALDVSKFPTWTCFTVDMKSFYSSVECVLRGIDPLEAYLAVVGDLSRPGSVVLAASPKMKKIHGIRTGSRHYEIPRAPHIHIVEARMGTYLEYSMHVPRILNRFVPLENIFVYSVDEAICVLDHSLFGDKWATVRAIQTAIKMELGLPSAIGLGDNYLQSKLALDLLSKKDEAAGYIAGVSYADFGEKLWGFPVKEIWGIGRRIEKRLNRMGIYTLGDLANTSIERLKRQFGNAIGSQLYYHAWGVDLTNPYHKPELNREALAQKGYSSGITLYSNYETEDVFTVMLEQAEEAARRMRAVKMAASTISLSIGYSDDDGGGGFSRSRTIATPTNITLKIYEVLKQLFKENHTGRLVRHVHVGLTKLSDDETYQLDLFEDNTKERELGYVMDKIRNKYGTTAVVRARSLTAGGTVLPRRGFIGGHKA
ncbi:Y-family DNA polymerase [Paenibacillus abyssi]|uniref:UV-damage repair protein UvrX n=1 Tax=Paenibacillus abyssi TaxID=1340531 RepID=A0A917G1P3_9BACL|nr:nucleotidyltransferase [Paenibacillus abyssi]GGG17662.1 putative UV-damage repair protein UvrX [Paenibacillus abyssi]